MRVRLQSPIDALRGTLADPSAIAFTHRRGQTQAGRTCNRAPRYSDRTRYRDNQFVLAARYVGTLTQAQLMQWERVAPELAIDKLGYNSIPPARAAALLINRNRLLMGFGYTPSPPARRPNFLATAWSTPAYQISIHRWSFNLWWSGTLVGQDSVRVRISYPVASAQRHARNTDLRTWRRNAIPTFNYLYTNPKFLYSDTSPFHPTTSGWISVDIRFFTQDGWPGSSTRFHSWLNVS